jgi:polyhydroxyalkanoate synthesis regulator phasin
MNGESSVPVPDPTKLTTDAVDRLREQVFNILDIRLSSAKELVDQKFIGVATEFTMRDIALAAAFKAAEAQVAQQNQSNQLAADKAATAFTKQIDNLDEKIDNLKEAIAQLTTRNYAAIGGYIVGAIGVVAIISEVLLRAH